MIKLYKLLLWLYNNAEITPSGSLCINSNGYLVQLGNHGIKIISDSDIQINGSNLYLQCTGDYLDEQYEQIQSVQNYSDAASSKFNTLSH